MAASLLGDALPAEITCLREFIALLLREQDFLKAADTAALLPLIDHKTQLSEQLAHFAQEREHELKRLGLSSDRSGMEAWLTQHGRVNDHPAWQTLLDLASEARNLNSLNGKLIGLHMGHNQQAFSALMGASNRAMTYGPDGQQQASLGGRILGTA